MSANNNLRAKVTAGIVWRFSELMLNRGAGGITTLILAWFLAPEDFGLIAMMAVFLGLSNVLIDAGLSQALIRKQGLRKQDYNAAFFANIVIACIVYVLLFISAPLIADFYSQQKLVDLIRIAGIALIFNGLSIVQRAVLIREFKFKLQMRVSLPATLISSAIAIVVAYLGYGVWALVIQLVLQALLNSLFYWCLRLWRPTFSFAWSDLVALVPFSSFLLLEQFTNILFVNMYVMTIANLYSASIAGYYYLSQKIREILIEQLVGSVQMVTYPTLARIQDNPERLKSGFRQIISAITFIISPFLVFLAALLDNIFHLLLPETWWPATIYIQLMCLSALMNPLNAINLNILKVAGRSDLVFYIGLFKKGIALAIFAVSYRYGIIAILLGQMLSSVLGYFPNSFYSRKLINYSMYEQAVDFIPSLLLASCVGFGVWTLQNIVNWHKLIELLVFGFGGVVTYIACAWILNISGLKLTHDLIISKMKQ